MDADFAEAEEDATARLRTTETDLRTEVGEHHYLVDLALDGLVVGARKDSVGDDLTLGIQGGFKE